ERRGPGLLNERREGWAGHPSVAEVRGRGCLRGIELVALPDEMHADERVEDVALEHGLLVATTLSTLDGYAGDEIVFAPAFTSSDQELEMMVDRLAATLREVAAN